jgi:hypothetical protein
MKKQISACLLACSWLMLAPEATQAQPTVTVVPTSRFIQPPQNVEISLVISGLQPPGGPNISLAAFDLTLRYDPSVFQALTFGASVGAGLGDVNDPTQTAIGADISTPGAMRVYEVSFLESSSTDCVFCTGPYLEDLQSGSRLLLTRQLFRAYNNQTPPGDYEFGLLRSEIILSDADGNQITNFNFTSGIVTVVPEPSAAWLLACGLCMLRASRRAGLRRG